MGPPRAAGLIKFELTKPWNAVFQDSVHSTSIHAKTFWDREARDKAFMYLAKLRSHADVTSPETAQSAGGRSGGPPSARKELHGVHQKKGRARNKAKRSGRGGSPDQRREPFNAFPKPKGSPGSGSGRASDVICRNWNFGNCSSPCPRGFRHVCDICESKQHRSSECPQASKSQGSGKGGKGKRKGSKE